MTSEVVVMPRESNVVRAEDFLPLMTIEQAVGRKSLVNQFIGQVLKEGEDYGDIPGASKKKVLLKPGAEKLCSIFGMAPTYIKETVIENWTGTDHGGEPLFYYEYRCQLSRGGRFMGEAIGSCNSWETKYRYRWVTRDACIARVDFSNLPERGGQKSMFEPNFAIEKAETSGKYGKPAAYWQAFSDAIANGTAKRGKKTMGKKEFDGWFLSVDETQYRIPNPDIADVINTCQKMAQKRSLVAAVLVVTNCSDAFTQDIEDFHEVELPNPPMPALSKLHEGGLNTLPQELQVLFQATVPAGAVSGAFAFVKLKLIEAFPETFDEEYRSILERNDIKPKGNTIVQSRNAVMQIFALANSTLRNKPKPAEDLGVSMSDMPYQEEPHQ